MLLCIGQNVAYDDKNCIFDAVDYTCVYQLSTFLKSVSSKSFIPFRCQCKNGTTTTTTTTTTTNNNNNNGNTNLYDSGVVG